MCGPRDSPWRHYTRLVLYALEHPDEDCDESQTTQDENTEGGRIDSEGGVTWTGGAKRTLEIGMHKERIAPLGRWGKKTGKNEKLT